MQLFVGVKAVIHFNGKILLLRESSEYQDGSKAGKWDVPGGRIESGETLEDALAREVTEESGLAIVKGKLLGAFDGFPVIRGEKCHVVRLYFLCEAKSDTVAVSKDHDVYEWVDPQDHTGRILMDDIEEMMGEAKKYI